MVAIGRDRPGRADVETFGTADDLRSGMGAQVILDFQIERFFETADKLRRLGNHFGHHQRIPRISAFIEKHHEDEVFIKRKRDKYRTDLADDGIGDARISQLTDVYRAPSRTKSQAVH